MSVQEPFCKLSYIELHNFFDDEKKLVNTLDEDNVDETGKCVFQTPFTYLPIHSKVMPPHGEELHSVKVKGQTKDLIGNLIRTYNKNTLLNSMLYDVELPDGAVKKYYANIIANNMYSQVDQDKFYQILIE